MSSPQIKNEFRLTQNALISLSNLINDRKKLFNLTLPTLRKIWSQCSSEIQKSEGEVLEMTQFPSPWTTGVPASILMNKHTVPHLAPDSRFAFYQLNNETIYYFYCLFLYIYTILHHVRNSGDRMKHTANIGWRVNNADDLTSTQRGLIVHGVLLAIRNHYWRHWGHLYLNWKPFTLITYTKTSQHLFVTGNIQDAGFRRSLQGFCHHCQEACVLIIYAAWDGLNLLTMDWGARGAHSQSIYSCVNLTAEMAARFQQRKVGGGGKQLALLRVKAVSSSWKKVVTANSILVYFLINLQQEQHVAL